MSAILPRVLSDTSLDTRADASSSDDPLPRAHSSLTLAELSQRRGDREELAMLQVREPALRTPSLGHASVTARKKRLRPLALLTRSSHTMQAAVVASELELRKRHEDGSQSSSSEENTKQQQELLDDLPLIDATPSFNDLF